MRGEADNAGERLQEIPGMVPALTDLPAGCAFAPRCAVPRTAAARDYPASRRSGRGHWAACWRSAERR